MPIHLSFLQSRVHAHTSSSGFLVSPHRGPSRTARPYQRLRTLANSLPEGGITRDPTPAPQRSLFSFAFPDAWLRGSELGWRSDFYQVYRLTSVCMGQGSWGEVRVAVHKESGQEVAVKTMSKMRRKFTREKTLDKIRREQQMLQRMQSCSSVVRLLALYEEANAVHLVQELCRGGDLRKLVEAHGRLDEACTASVALQVLQAVKSCHDQGILYGDIKPANFCLVEPFSGSGAGVGAGAREASGAAAPCTLQIRAVDFGNSVTCGEAHRLSKRRGTLTFLSPEVYSQSYGLKADIWSLGVMLYWLFSQRYPFWRSSEPPAVATLADMEMLVKNATIPYDFDPWLSMSPEGLDFMRRCLQHDESLRLSAGEALLHPWIQAVQLQL